MREAHSRLLRTALVSFAAATAVSCVYWFLCWRPLDVPFELQQFLTRHWRKADFIPSLFSLLLPLEWRSGLHLYFREITYCFPGPPGRESMRYLRTAIPAYTVVFFTTGVGIRRLRSFR
jgi:hypothetical protein